MEIEMSSNTISNWLLRMASPHFPWRTLEEEIDSGEESDGEVEEEEETEEEWTKNDPFLVDPLRGWQRKVLKVGRTLPLLLLHYCLNRRREGGWTLGGCLRGRCGWGWREEGSSWAGWREAGGRESVR